MSFGPFEVDLQSEELWKHGIRPQLSGQAFRVLSILLHKPNQLVTRDELQKALWPADTSVDFEKGVNSAVNRLREVFGGLVGQSPLCGNFAAAGVSIYCALVGDARDGRTRDKGKRRN
jgi:DNA-binding response OmpR family regulator